MTWTPSPIFKSPMGDLDCEWYEGFGTSITTVAKHPAVSKDTSGNIFFNECGEKGAVLAVDQAKRVVYDQGAGG
jgi:hypothetical protein